MAAGWGLAVSRRPKQSGEAELADAIRTADVLVPTVTDRIDAGLIAQAGEVLGIKQPHVSALMRNRAGNFSVGRLIEFLTALGQDVQITVKPARKARGEMELVVR